MVVYDDCIIEHKQYRTSSHSDGIIDDYVAHFEYERRLNFSVIPFCIVFTQSNPNAFLFGCCFCFLKNQSNAIKKKATLTNCSTSMKREKKTELLGYSEKKKYTYFRLEKKARV